MGFICFVIWKLERVYSLPFVFQWPHWVTCGKFACLFRSKQGTFLGRTGPPGDYGPWGLPLCLLHSVTLIQGRWGPRCIFMISGWICLLLLPVGSSPASLPIQQPHCSALMDGADWANCYADEPLSYLSKCSREISRDKPHFREGFIHSLGWAF